MKSKRKHHACNRGSWRLIRSNPDHDRCLSRLAQDAEAGKKVFLKCKACHFADQDKNKIGPSLRGVIGRTAGTHEGFKYSPAMIEAGRSGLVWDEAALAEYLRNAKGMVKGTTMAFPGLKSDEDIANVIAYLKQQPQ